MQLATLSSFTFYTQRGCHNSKLASYLGSLVHKSVGQLVS